MVSHPFGYMPIYEACRLGCKQINFREVVASLFYTGGGNMTRDEAITLVLNTLYEVSQIENGRSPEALKTRLIEYKAKDLLNKLKDYKEG